MGAFVGGVDRIGGVGFSVTVGRVVGTDPPIIAEQIEYL